VQKGKSGHVVINGGGSAEQTDNADIAKVLIGTDFKGANIVHNGGDDQLTVEVSKLGKLLKSSTLTVDGGEGKDIANLDLSKIGNNIEIVEVPDSKNIHLVDKDTKERIELNFTNFEGVISYLPRADTPAQCRQAEAYGPAVGVFNTKVYEPGDLPIANGTPKANGTQTDAKQVPPR